MAKERVVVAMSGGVDSSVAAALLVQQGYDTIGIMLRLWSETVPSTVPASNRCCTPDQMADARRVADHLEIPFYVIDAQTQFREVVVQEFINEHAAGNTPNPCIACNRQIRFTYLLAHAQALGARYLATGHYARVSQHNGEYRLLKGIDPLKDQSYVLHVLDQEKLAAVLFPVGVYTKAEVRRLAQEFELPVAGKHDSQDLCFIGDGDYRGFLKRQSANSFAKGPIVDQEGHQLGIHNGLPHYTIGQRKGLGVTSDTPLYVIRKDLSRNALVVGPFAALQQMSFLVNRVNWIAGHPITPQQDVQIKIRYRAKAVHGSVIAASNARGVVKLKEPVAGVTSGQSAVFFDGDICLGGGVIADQNHDWQEAASASTLEENQEK